jgi:PTH1 family peptidyl-tRNA hydrolase
MDKFLICGLGNPGDEYAGTRHNTGWMAVDAFAEAMGAEWRDRRYGFVAEASLKGRKIFILKPTTFMNLSGNAVRYWLNEEKIDQSRLLVISDDVALPLGELAATTDWGISCSSSDRTSHACGLVSATTIPAGDR